MQPGLSRGFVGLWSLLVSSALVVACADSGDSGARAKDGGGDVGTSSDARASTDDGGSGEELDAPGSTSLAPLADAVMTDAIDATSTDLSQCVGAVAVIVTPTETLVRGYGATARGGATRPDGRTLFQIGSITKALTGLGLARLVHEGAAMPSTSAGALLADDLATAAASWPTLMALITHHAGLPVFPDNLVDRDGDGQRDPAIDPRSPAAGYTREHLRDALHGWAAPADAPYLYSNLGLGLAAIALQDHLGLASYHATLRRLVTDELGMHETWGEVDAVDPPALERLAEGQALNGTVRIPGIPGRMGVLAGAGEIVTTADDMAIFLAAMTGLHETPLEPAISLATTPLAPGPDGRDVGYAIEIERRASGDVFRKGGNTSSYSAYVMWSRDPALGVAVMTNCGGFIRVVSLAEALFDGAAAD